MSYYSLGEFFIKMHLNKLYEQQLNKRFLTCREREKKNKLKNTSI